MFQVLIESVKAEAAEVAREAGRDFGLGAALSSAAKSTSQNGHAIVNGSASLRDRELEVTSITKSVFDGLTANRRSCVECGYTEAVMHFSFDNWQLALPRSVRVSLQASVHGFLHLSRAHVSWTIVSPTILVWSY